MDLPYKPGVYMILCKETGHYIIQGDKIAMKDGWENFLRLNVNIYHLNIEEVSTLHSLFKKPEAILLEIVTKKEKVDSSLAYWRYRLKGPMMVKKKNNKYYINQ